MELKTEGIVLRRFDGSERDTLGIVFTKQAGKVAVIARGTKPAGKLKPALEIFSLSDFRLVRKNDDSRYFAVAGAVIKDSRHGIRSDMDRMAVAFAFAELTDRFMQNEEISDDIYELLSSGLHAADAAPIEVMPSLSAWFKARLLKFTGFSASMDEDYLEAIASPEEFRSAVARFELLDIPPVSLMENETEVNKYLDGYIVSILSEELKSLKFYRGLN